MPIGSLGLLDLQFRERHWGIVSTTGLRYPAWYPSLVGYWGGGMFSYGQEHTRKPD